MLYKDKQIIKELISKASAILYEVDMPEGACY